jgi:hypothetical protein
MLEHDRGNFYALMTGLFEMYGKRASPELLEIYFGALTAYDLADLARAANHHALDPDQGQFMPKPADFVRHIDGSKETRAMRAWSLVERAVRQVGQYVSVTFDDPVIHRVIEDMGGWVDLCSTKTEKDFEFRGIEFGKRYQGYVLQGGVTEWQPRLIGLEEADCASRKLPLPSPKLIGNPERAKMVLLEGAKSAPRLVHTVSEVLGNVVMLGHRQDGAA